MSHDDPKFTAYALNELDSNEAAEIERIIPGQPHASAEIAETREMAEILRGTLKAEQAPALGEHRRDAVLRAASIAGKSLQPSLENVAEPAWWQRVGFWQLAAACMVFGFGVYALSVSMGGDTRKGTGVAQSGNEQTVQIGNLTTEGSGHQEAESGLKMPTHSEPGGASSVAVDLNVTKTNPSFVASVPNDLANKLQPVVSKSPQVVGTNDPLAQFKARADIGKVQTKGTTKSPYSPAAGPHEQVVLRTDNGEVKLTGEEANRYFSVREYLDARWREASSLREGTSYAELARIFRHESYADGTHRFVMIRCPSIKVGVSFVSKDNTEAEWPLAPDTKIRTISKPYFEPEQGN